MTLNLTKPICFFDLETTGVNISKDRIVEISILKVYPDGKEESKTWLVNPKRPIPKEVTAIHGISDEDVANEPAFKELAKEIHNIIKEIKPDGLLIKSDLTSSELAEAFQIILHNPPYYSSTVKGFVSTTMSSDIHLDDVNRKILHLLSQGVKTKSLKEHIDLSMSAIEKRKKQLKLLFDVFDGKDETLLNEARKKGFI